MTRPYVITGRSRRVREHLVSSGGGVTSRDLINILADGSTKNTMCATLANLEQAGKARREVVGGVARYYPTANTLVDARRRPGARSRPRKPVEQVANVQAPVAAALAASAPRRMSLNALFLKPSDRQLDRHAIATDVAAFEAAGGTVQKLAWGDTGESLRAAQATTSRATKRTT